MAIKKNVVKIETRSKNGKSWKCIITKEDNGQERDNHIFDKALANKFSQPGIYEVNMTKNEKGFWNISECLGEVGVSVPEAPQTAQSARLAQPTEINDYKREQIVFHCLRATSTVYQGHAFDDKVTTVAMFAADLDELVRYVTSIIAGDAIAAEPTKQQEEIPF